MNELLLQNYWRELLDVWSVDREIADATFVEICWHYAEPGRFYHTLEHIAAMLETVDSLASIARNLNPVRLAVWLHDVIYDSRASDNEERSAEHAERMCDRLSISQGCAVSSLILKTKRHEADDDPDAQLLLDADLAILGASESVYLAYAEQIRKEYAWVPEPDYRKARRQVLERFLARPSIFHLLVHLEETARQNLAAEIARL